MNFIQQIMDAMKKDKNSRKIKNNRKTTVTRPHGQLQNDSAIDNCQPNIQILSQSPVRQIPQREDQNIQGPYLLFNRVHQQHELLNPSESPPCQVHQSGIFKVKKIRKRCKNTPNSLVRALLDFLPQQFRYYPSKAVNKLRNQFKILRKLRAKRNQKGRSKRYGVAQLTHFMCNDKSFQKETLKLNRIFCRKILSEHFLSYLLKPQCQITGNRKDYLLNAKVYGLRCMHSKLAEKNNCT